MTIRCIVFPEKDTKESRDHLRSEGTRRSEVIDFMLFDSNQQMEKNEIGLLDTRVKEENIYLG